MAISAGRVDLKTHRKGQSSKNLWLLLFTVFTELVNLPLLMGKLWKKKQFLMGKLWKITRFNGEININQLYLVGGIPTPPKNSSQLG